MNAELPKPVRRQMRDIVGAAWEQELRRALLELDGQFDQWRRGEIDPFRLVELVHQFHNGPAREIYSRFSDQRNSALVMLTAYAVANGLVDEKAVPPEVLPYIENSLRFYREGARQGVAE